MIKYSKVIALALLIAAVFCLLPGCGGKPPGRREHFRFHPGSYMDNGCILGSAEPGRQPPQPEAAGRGSAGLGERSDLPCRFQRSPAGH